MHNKYNTRKFSPSRPAAKSGSGVRNAAWGHLRLRHDGALRWTRAKLGVLPRRQDNRLHDIVVMVDLRAGFRFRFVPTVDDQRDDVHCDHPVPRDHDGRLPRTEQLALEAESHRTATVDENIKSKSNRIAQLPNPMVMV